MIKNNIYGKAKNNFYKVAEHSLEGIWDYKLEGYEEIDFVGARNYMLEEKEIFFINTKDEDIQEYLNRIKNTSACNTIDKKGLKNLETLYVFEETNNKFHLYIKRIMPGARVEKAYLSWGSKLARIETEQVHIPIDNYTHLYWNQEKQKIYFRKFSDLEIVFPSFSKYYREATQEDTELFRNSEKYPFLKVEISDFQSLPKTKLKTIAMIVDELESVGKKFKFKEHKTYAIKYKDVLKYKQGFVKDDKFEINDSKDIDNLADIVFRKIYTPEAGEKEIRRANSYKIFR